MISDSNKVTILLGLLNAWRDRPQTPTRMRMIQRVTSAIKTLADKEVARSTTQWDYDEKRFDEVRGTICLPAYRRIDNGELTDDDVRHLDRVGILNVDWLSSNECGHLCWSRNANLSELFEESLLEEPSGCKLDFAKNVLEYVESMS